MSLLDWLVGCDATHVVTGKVDGYGYRKRMRCEHSRNHDGLHRVTVEHWPYPEVEW